MATSSEEFLSVACPCDGHNESCYRCGGWGYIDKIGTGRSDSVANGVGPSVYTPHLPKKKLPKQQPPLPQRASQKKGGNNQSEHRSRPAVQQDACPLCSRLVTNLCSHLLNAHFKTPADSPLVNQASPQVRCRDCGEWVKRAQYAHHLWQKHPPPRGHFTVAPSLPAGPGSTAKSRKQTKTAARAKRGPGPGSFFHVTKKGPRTGVVQQAGTASGKASCTAASKEQPIERQLDGARDHYAAYREHGRFGSHASFDDYGDESGP